MIACLRFLALLNAAIWFGAVFFYVVGVTPGLSSHEVVVILSPRYFPYFSTAIAQVVAQRCLYVELICGALALLLYVIEWLYTGRWVDRVGRALAAGVLVLALVDALALQPALRKWHQEAYGQRTQPERRKVVFNSFRAWQTVADVLNFFSAGGLGVLVWRVANPPSPTRFVSTTRFRG